MVYYLSDEVIREKALLKQEAVAEKFKELCEKDSEFLSSFESSTKDLDKTVKRFSTWGSALSEVTEVAIPIPKYLKWDIKFEFD
jgi:hypothetical protein